MCGRQLKSALIIVTASANIILIKTKCKFMTKFPQIILTLHLTDSKSWIRHTLYNI